MISRIHLFRLAGRVNWRIFVHADNPVKVAGNIDLLLDRWEILFGRIIHNHVADRHVAHGVADQVHLGKAQLLLGRLNCFVGVPAILVVIRIPVVGKADQNNWVLGIIRELALDFD